MKEVGFAVVEVSVDTKIVGICPISLKDANITRLRYMSSKPGKYEVVPIFIGAPIPPKVLDKIVLSKGGSNG